MATGAERTEVGFRLFKVTRFFNTQRLLTETREASAGTRVEARAAVAIDRESDAMRGIGTLRFLFDSFFLTFSPVHHWPIFWSVDSASGRSPLPRWRFIKSQKSTKTIRLSSQKNASKAVDGFRRRKRASIVTFLSKLKEKALATRSAFTPHTFTFPHKQVSLVRRCCCPSAHVARFHSGVNARA
jgi:hypothetical protein